VKKIKEKNVVLDEDANAPSNYINSSSPCTWGTDLVVTLYIKQEQILISHGATRRLAVLRISRYLFLLLDTVLSSVVEMALCLLSHVEPVSVMRSDAGKNILKKLFSFILMIAGW